jgi:HAD superfamily hydrolase (TIGR01549 family)
MRKVFFPMGRPDLRVLLFDLGGTLMYEKDPWPPIISRAEEALHVTLASAGIQLGPEAYGEGVSFLDFYTRRRQARSDHAEVISSSLLRMLLEQNGYLGVDEQVVRQALQAMYAVTQTNWVAEEDALPVLQTLRSAGYRLGLVSNAADDDNTQILIDKGGIRPYVEFIVSSAACAIRKPHPRIFELALDFFKEPVSKTAMIGDVLDADILGANQLGIFSIWITRRAQPTAEQLASIKPRAQVDTLLELPALLGLPGGTWT